MNTTLKICGSAALAIALAGCNRPADTAQLATETSEAEVGIGEVDVAEVGAADAGVADAPSSLSAQAGDGTILTQEGVGVVEGNVLEGTGTAGFLAFGPYASLAAGDYTVTFIGASPTLPEGAVVRFDVASALGSQVHGEQALSASTAQSGELAKFDFSLPTAVADLEVRVEVAGRAVVVLQSYSITQR